MAIIWNQKVEIGWNNHQQKYFLSLGYPKLKQGEKFTVPISLLTTGNSTKVDMVCDNCLKVFKGNYNKSHSYSNQFCSLKCNGELKKKRGNDTRKCLVCDKEFTFNKTRQPKAKCCSRECQNNWQSTHLVGKNAVGYKHEVKDRVISCSWCSKEFEVRPYKLKEIEKRENKRAFCSKACRRDWYAKDWSQRDEWRETMKKVATQSLSSGIMDKTDTLPQLIVNNILKELDVEFVNEYNLIYFAIDNYIPDNNLMIEVMGSYWHTDHRHYDKIKYQMQLDRCTMDKRKKTYVENKYETKILYIWESDVVNNPDMVKDLISLYVQNNGKLLDYHSFNYFYVNDIIYLSNTTTTPYFEMDSEDRLEYIDFSDKIKSGKQEDRWIKFNCEYCGKEHEQLESRYVKRDQHFCSQECKKNMGRVKYNCDNCDKEMVLPKYRLNDLKSGKLQSLCCSKDCSSEYRRKHFSKENHVQFTSAKKRCRYCESDFYVEPYRYEKKDFCNKDCRRKYNNKNYNCDSCGETMIVPRYKVEELQKGKRKSICCSKECMYEFKRKSLVI